MTTSFIQRVRPVRNGTGFQMDGYWVWCGSVIRGEDKRYHMFASRWPKTLPFHPGWLTDSEIVRAVADRPEGPFEFQEVVLGKRGAEYWDGCMAHNPMICRQGGKYILFYTGSTYPFAPLQPHEAADNTSKGTFSTIGRHENGESVIRLSGQ